MAVSNPPSTSSLVASEDHALKRMRPNDTPDTSPQKTTNDQQLKLYTQERPQGCKHR